MGLFGKKKKEGKREELPLPPAPPRFPEMEEVKRAISFPNEELFMQPMPKMPFLQTPGSSEDFPEPPISQKKVIEEMPPREIVRESREIKPVRIIQPVIEMDRASKLRTKMKEPIFVKIEKFKDALASFEEIKEDLDNSFELLAKIRETREQEKEEIEKWEREITEIKEKIEGINSKLFSNIETEQ